MSGPRRNRHRELVRGLFGIRPRRGEVLAHGLGGDGNLSGEFGPHRGADEGRGARRGGVSSALFEGRGVRTGGRGVDGGGVRLSMQGVPVQRLLRHSFARAGEQERGIGVGGVGMVRGEHGAHGESDETGGGVFGGMSRDLSSERGLRRGRQGDEGIEGVSMPSGQRRLLQGSGLRSRNRGRIVGVDGSGMVRRKFGSHGLAHLRCGCHGMSRRIRPGRGIRRRRESRGGQPALRMHRGICGFLSSSHSR
mmetsp:Transcript_2618/g.5440  ORF Transcript_2618/g.5440 Transcript_2618/m.5440 type:complete len:250 (+) Transcript_2618:664-1413(+)